MARDAKLNSSRSKTREQLIQELDERLRLNSGQFTNLASDTGSSSPFLINEGKRVQDAQGMGFQNPKLNFDIPQAPSTQVPEYQSVMPEPQGQVMGESDLGENPTPDQMLQAIFTESWEPQLPSTEQLDTLYQQTGQVYPTQSMQDGSVRYNDGSIKYPQEENPLPIASMADGSVLWSDGFLRERPPEGLSGYLAGVQGLSQMLFGQDQAVTQEYGNYNPELEPGSGYNMGTDFRTKNLSNKRMFAPVPMKVVEIYQDDGTQWGDQSGHQGYGNSVLVQLPSGEYLRLSHLSEMGNLQVGQTLNPGEFIGVPGTTGNTAGEHLDVEFYNAQGEIDNPSNFRTNASVYNQSNKIVGVSPYGKPNNQSIQEQPQQPAQAQGSTLPLAAQAITQPLQTARETGEALGQALGQTTQRIGQAAQPMSPERQALGEGFEKTGQTLGIPEVFGSEVASGAISPGMAIRKNIEQVKPTGDKFDLGASELASLDFQGAKNIFSSTASRVANRVSRLPGQLKDEVIPQAFAGDGVLQNTKESLGDNLGYIGDAIKAKGQQQVDRFQNVASQAGEGIKNLTQGGLDTVGNIFKKTSLANVGPSRMVGEESPGGDQGNISNSLVNSKAFTPSNDVRDEFFKSGQDSQFGDFIRPENIGNGALSLGLFNDNFFTGEGALDRIKGVFGGSAMEGEAEGKFSMWKSAEDARRAEEEQSRVQPTLDDYLRQGKTPAQYYAETGQQSVADSAGGSERAAATQQAQVSSSQAQQNQIKGNGGATSVTSPSGRAVTAPRGQKVYVDSSGQPQLVADRSFTLPGGKTGNFDTPVSNPSAQLNRQAPAQGKNIFSRGASTIRNIFGR